MFLEDDNAKMVREPQGPQPRTLSMVGPVKG